MRKVTKINNKDKLTARISLQIFSGMHLSIGMLEKNVFGDENSKSYLKFSSFSALQTVSNRKCGLSCV